MNNNALYVKTAAGADEVKARSRALPPRLRTMLIMVDGTRTAAQLLAAATTLGAPADFLSTLLQMGLVQVRTEVRTEARTAAPAPAMPIEQATPEMDLPSTDGERFRVAQKFMNDSVVDALGLRAFFFTLKLEKAANCDDLRLLLPEFFKAVAKGAGEDKARRFEARARQTLG